jgi:hypothetical protein
MCETDSLIQRYRLLVPVKIDAAAFTALKIIDAVFKELPSEPVSSPIRYHY